MRPFPPVRPVRALSFGNNSGAAKACIASASFWPFREKFKAQLLTPRGYANWVGRTKLSRRARGLRALRHGAASGPVWMDLFMRVRGGGSG
jgi:hypothetical protein